MLCCVSFVLKAYQYLREEVKTFQGKPIKVGSHFIGLRLSWKENNLQIKRCSITVCVFNILVSSGDQHILYQMHPASGDFRLSSLSVYAFLSYIQTTSVHECGLKSQILSPVMQNESAEKHTSNFFVDSSQITDFCLRDSVRGLLVI